MIALIQLVILLQFTHLSQAECPRSIIVNSSVQLEGIFCNYHQYEECSDIRLLLDTSITHEITSGDYCTINISHSLTITSIATDSLAHINCVPNNEVHNDKYWTRGFAFHGTNGSLTMKGLNFTNCGTNLTTLDSNIVNFTSSPIHFTSYHAAVLVFTEIGTTNIENIAIASYNGFAVVAINLPNAFFSYLYITHSQNFDSIDNSNYMSTGNSNYMSTGSGMLVLTCNSSVTINDHYNVTILNSIFYKNFASNQYYYKHKQQCISEIRKHYQRLSMPIVNAAGLTILYTQSDVPATVNIVGSTFYLCQGFLAGALMVFRLDSPVSSQTNIYGSQFTKNSVLSHCHGAAIVGSFHSFSWRVSNTKFYQPLTIANTTFIKNGHALNWGSGAINIALTTVGGKDTPLILFLFKNITCAKNEAQTSGSCMYISTYDASGYIYKDQQNPAYIIMESVIAYDNDISFKSNSPENYIPVSVFNFLHFKNITISGSESSPGIFLYNYGSVFEIIDADIILKGNLIFKNNIANHGAAIFLQGRGGSSRSSCHIYLSQRLYVRFVNNSAQSLGGAIFSAGESSDLCTFQVLSEDFNKTSLFFIGNTAELAGDSIYSSSLYKCSMKIGKKRFKHQTIYEKVFKNIGLRDLASYPNVIKLCDPKMQYEVYPGASLHIPVSVLDNDNRPTYALVTAIAAQNQVKKLGWWFSNNQQISIGRNNCTQINLTFHSNDPSTFNKEAMLLFSISEASKVNGSTVIVKDCPPGFNLDTLSGACVCSWLLLEVVRIYHGQRPLCQIENSTFSRSNILNLWIGTNATGKEFRISYCNPSYCNLGSQFDAMFINKSGPYLTSSTTSVTISLCHSSRKGDLCGECNTNYSVVFGSTKCKLCSNKWWPFTSVLYILAGPLLVFLLYTFKLTLTTGTLNGVIFYAQVTNVGVTKFLKIPCSECGNEIYFVRLASTFISWLNLNLGFPLCFYNGMTELWKTGLSLLFPVYLLFIVGFLIILSHLSTKVSNLLSKSSVQVLVTVVHLSFTQLLQAILDVFSSAQIYIENKGQRKVWFKNGAIEYGNIEHKILMIITSVVVGVILIPYVVVVLFGKHLLRFDSIREYIRPFYEAIHAPYKMNKWYWFGIHQTYVLIVYIVESIGGGHSLFLIFFLILIQIFQLITTFQAFSIPFKTKICFDFKQKKKKVRRGRYPYDEGSFFDDQYCDTREPLLEHTQ
uniref:Transmembrane protein n=1 Tax=Amphimedon queenslandica TaxID=400682 RepID=A0A1X7V7B4_AMPQE